MMMQLGGLPFFFRTQCAHLFPLPCVGCSAVKEIAAVPMDQAVLGDVVAGLCASLRCCRWQVAADLPVFFLAERIAGERSSFIRSSSSMHAVCRLAVDLASLLLVLHSRSQRRAMSDPSIWDCPHGTLLLDTRCDIVHALYML
jgi:hypothetical protein